ncbi:MAG: esterase, partial [Myxococcales bacterium]|nr:esterase [Myxococcales bacterium]
MDDPGGTGGTGGTGGGASGAGGEGGAGPEPCAETTELTNSEFVGGTTLEAGSCYVVNQNLTLDDGTVTIEE